MTEKKAGDNTITRKRKAGDHAILRDSLYGTTSEPTYAGALSFMRRKYTRDLEGVDLVVAGVPLDMATTNRPGARLGPRAIRAASTLLAFERPYGMAFDPFDKLAVVDYGDCFFDFGRPETIPSTIEEHAYQIIDKGPGLLSLGGDHFVAYPLIKAHVRKHGAPLSLLHFDAHSDAWNDEEGRVDHGTMFYHAVKEGNWRQTSLSDFRHRLPGSELRARHGYAGLRRADHAPGDVDYPRSYGNQSDRNGSCRSGAGLRCWRNYGPCRRTFGNGDDLRLRQSAGLARNWAACRH